MIDTQVLLLLLHYLGIAIASLSMLFFIPHHQVARHDQQHDDGLVDPWCRTSAVALDCWLGALFPIA